VLDGGPDPPTGRGTFDGGYVLAYCNVPTHVHLLLHVADECICHCESDIAMRPATT